VLRLRYEDFTADPAGTLRRLRLFAGLPDDPEALRLLGAPGDDPGSTPPPAVPFRAHSVAGNPLRFSGGPLTVRRDEAWRTRLPLRSRAVVSLATLPFRVRYGYLGQRRSSESVETS
jgi:hypothetical protein